ncbi:MAG: zf-HC2 domain-containing protein, partial [Gemmatimonadales bacterium]
MQHPEEGMIHAWLDGELSEDQANEIAAHARDCPECSAKVAEARGLIAASTRILTALDNVPTGVIPEAPSTIPLSTPARRRRWFDRTDIRAAAAVLVVAGASYIVMKRDSETTTDSLMVADRVESVPMAASKNAPVAPATPKETAAIFPPVVAQRTTQPSARRAEAPPTAGDVEKPLTKTTVAGEVGQAPPMLRMDAAAAPPSLKAEGASLSEVVVTGAAKATTMATASMHIAASPSPR